jgi:hypothetical protein
MYIKNCVAQYVHIQLCDKNTHIPVHKRTAQTQKRKQNININVHELSRTVRTHPARRQRHTNAHTNTHTHTHTHTHTQTSMYINRVARYVRIQLAGTNYLSLAEVEVWGYAPVEEWQHIEGMRRWTRLEQVGDFPFGRMGHTGTMITAQTVLVVGGYVNMCACARVCIYIQRERHTDVYWETSKVIPA